MKRHIIILFAILVVIISSKHTFSQIEYCYNWDAVVYGYSDILYDDQAYLVSGLAGTSIIVFDYTPWVCDNDYTAWVYSELAHSGGVLSYGRLESNDWDVDGRHPVFNAQPRTYCVTSAHGLAAYMVYDDGEIIQFETAEFLAGYTRACHTFPPPPTPTPTPTPTPCPFPLIEECADPRATISQLNLVEKHGIADVTVGVTNADGLTTTFSLRTTAGTGSATYEDGTTTKSFTGNVSSQVLRVKGVTESSQIDNIIIEAKYGNRVLASDPFTVAVISSIEFQRINAGDLDFDENPGTDGIPNTDMSEGQRIFPDRNAPDDQTDRSIIRVRAVISPAMPGAKVYFASFDLDDPSAVGPPIDTATNPNDGNDNNGAVSQSKSGELINPQGGTLCDRASISNHISKIECTAASKGAMANYRLTMQPGDNYAVAASLVETYRSQIHVDQTAGGNLINNTNQIIPISSEANPNNIQGIRTRMLTTWRRLHIEVDSLGVAIGNKVEGTMTETRKINSGTKTLMVNPTNPTGPLEPDRFENGRMVINGRSYQIIDAVPATATTPAVVANTTDSVTIRVVTTFNITPTSTFTLYDDDDMDDDGGGYQYLNGDEGDDVREADIDLLLPDDTACIVGTDGKVRNSCNGLLSAYTKPTYDLDGSHTDIPFSSNINVADITAINNNIAYFQNLPSEGRSDFWTIYMVGSYQFTLISDNDPSGNVTWGRADALQGGIGLFTFNEPNRPTEYNILNEGNLPPGVDVWQNRPVEAKYNTLHELGHLFNGQHQDCQNFGGNAGVMRQFGNITRGVFCDETLFKIRGGTGVVNP